MDIRYIPNLRNQNKYDSAKVSYIAEYIKNGISEHFRYDLRENVNKIRESMKDGKSKDALRVLKTQLPSIMFSLRPDSDNAHTGLIVFDIDKDGLNNYTPETLMEHIRRQNEYVLMAFISPSGCGVKIVVRTDCTNREDHNTYFDRLSARLANNYPVISIDMSGRNVNRLCFLSYDNEIFYNPECEVYKMPEQYKQSVIQLNKKPEQNAESAEKSKAFIKDFLDYCKNNSIDICSGYDEWMRLAHILKYTGSTVDVFDQYSQLSPTYKDKKDTKSLWNKVVPDGSITVKTLFRIAKSKGFNWKEYRESNNVKHIDKSLSKKNIQINEADIKENDAPFPNSFLCNFGPDFSYDQIIDHCLEMKDNKVLKEVIIRFFIRNRYKFIKDIIKDKIYIFDRHNLRCNVIQDDDYPTLSIEILDTLSINAAKDGIISSCIHDKSQLAAYNHVDTILNQLTPKETGAVRKVVECLGYKDVDSIEYRTTYMIVKKWLMGSIVCARGISSNDLCLILQGSQQGQGKSFFMKYLGSFWGDEYFTTFKQQLDSYEAIPLLHKYLTVDLDELESLNKKDMSYAKSFITTRDISYRKKFGKVEQHYIRRCSFVGTTNPKQFLTDTTGNRRWGVIEVLGCSLPEEPDKNVIDIKSLPPIKELYEEALYLVDIAKENHWLSGADEKLINENATKHQVESREMALIRDIVLIPGEKGYEDAEKETLIIPKSVFQEYIQHNIKANLNGREFNKALDLLDISVKVYRASGPIAEMMGGSKPFRGIEIELPPIFKQRIIDFFGRHYDKYR